MPDFYGRFADEYYDGLRHPTAANLRAGSLIAITALLDGAQLGLVCELGAGRSIFVDLREQLSRVSELVLIDGSAEMLRHSDTLSGARKIIGDVSHTALPARYFDCVISSLGDAYNRLDTWRHVVRSLKVGGRIIYTGPALPWAKRYRALRQDGREEEADFDVVDGVISVPSYVHSRDSQLEMWRDVGLTPLKWIEIFPADIPRPHSPKILNVDEPFCIGISAVMDI